MEKPKKILLLFFALAGLSATAQLKIGNNPAVMNSNSALEIESSNKGILLPRLALTGTSSAAPLSAHVAGMIIYNTATTADVVPGFYYNDGSQWISTSNIANLAGKANINSPVFTGTPQAPTPAAGDNSTNVATTAFVTTAVNNAVIAGGGAVDLTSGPIRSAAGVSSIHSQTGTGGTFVMNDTPTLIKPDLGAATAASINATPIPANSTLVTTNNKLNVMASTTSAELATVVPDETGTGSLVFQDSPEFTGSVILPSGAVGYTQPLGDKTTSLATTQFVIDNATAIIGSGGGGGSPSNLVGPISSVGSLTSVTSQTGVGTKFVMDDSPALIGTPTAPTRVASDNSTAIATTAFVKTAVAAASSNVSLTGPITSSGSVTSVTSQTGFGTKFVMDDTPVISNPTLTGTPTAPTPIATSNNTTIATTAFVKNAISGVSSDVTSGPVRIAAGVSSIPSTSGTGSTVVMSNSPTLVTPILGAATATSINGTTIPTSSTLVKTTDKLNVLAATNSTELAGVVSDETGTGSLVFANSPALTGTPTAPTAIASDNSTAIATTAFVKGALSSAGDITSGPIRSTGGTSSIALSTGSGSTVVLANSPTLVSPNIGAATATSINGTAIPTSSTLVKTTDKLNVLAATNSTELAGVVSDETGTGSLVFANNPALAGVPTAPTAAPNTNTTQLATTAFVTTAVNNAVISGGGAVNLSGPIGSVGSATFITDQTGTGNKFVMSDSPTLVTPVLGVATATSINGTTIPTSKTLVTTDSNLGNFGATASADLAIVMTDETGTGKLVFSDSPVFTGNVILPATAQGVTLPAGSNTPYLATTEFVTTAMANAAAAGGGNLTAGPIRSTAGTSSLNAQTGNGEVIVVQDSPTLVTPTLGVATATSINGTAIPASSTLVKTTDKLNTLAATTSAELSAVISDETGTNKLVYSDSPTLNSPAMTGTPTAPTPAAGDNSTKVATTAFVTTAVASAGAPALVVSTLKTANYTALPNETLIQCEANSPMTLTLPTMGIPAGKIYYVSNKGIQDVTINPLPANTAMAAAQPGLALILIWTGTEWVHVSGY